MSFKLKSKNPIFSEINVTPLVDVMLVLLVIFMITAPLMLNGIQLDLPKTKEVNPLKLNSSQVILSLSKDKELFLGKEKVSRDKILDAIKKEFKINKTEVLYIRADNDVTYGIVANLMSYLKKGGISTLALVTETDPKK